MKPRAVSRLVSSLFLQEARSFQSIFWMLLFPVFLLALFGLIFGQEGFREGSVIVGVDESLRDGDPGIFMAAPEGVPGGQALRWFPHEEGIRALEDGAIYAFITKTEGDAEYTVLITERFKQVTPFLGAVMDRIQAEGYRRILRGKAFFPYRLEILQVNGMTRSYIAYLLSGIIGISFMLNFFFAIPQTIISYRSMGFLKRFANSPMTKGEFTLSLILVRGIIAVFQVGILSVAAVLLFDVRFSLAPVPFALTFALGCAAFGAVGFFISGVIDSIDASSAVAQILTMLFMFTAGIFFPLEMMPGYFSVVAGVNPVYYLSRALFSTMLAGKGFMDVRGDLLALAIFFIVSFTLTMLTFRYDRRK